MIHFLLVLQFVVFVSNSILGALVLKANYRAEQNIFYAAFSFALAFWNLAVLFTVLGVWPQLMWSRLGFSFGVVMSAALFYFALVFPAGTSLKHIQKIRNGLIITGLGLFILTLTKWMVARVEVVDGYITGDLGFVTVLFTIFVLSGFFGGLGVLIWKYKKSRGLKRTQLSYVLLGFLFFICTFLTTNLILPIFFGIFKYNSLGPVFSLPMVAIIGYAIVQHRLMDIRVVIQRGALYTIIAGLVVAIYLIALQFFRQIFEGTTEAMRLFSSITATVVGVLGAPLVRIYFRKATDHIFFKDGYNFEEAMHRLGTTLNRSTNTNSIITKTQEDLADIFKTEKAKLLLRPGTSNASKKKKDNIFEIYSYELVNKAKDENGILVRSEVPHILERKGIKPHARNKVSEVGKYLEKHNYEILVPLVLDREVLGILLMKDKRSGDPYNKRDIYFLRIFAQQAAVSLKKAELYEQVKEYSQKLEEKVRARTRKIEMLRQAQKDMMVEISHQLQTPLSTMKIQLYMMKKQMPKKDHNVLKDLERSIDEISKFVYDFMRLARMDSFQEDFKLTRINLGSFCKDLAEYFSVLSEGRNIQIETDIQNGIYVAADEKKLEEAVTNLVVNAIKYMPADKKERKILIKVFDEGKDAKLIVQDTGKGIPKDELPYVFERFYRTEEAKKPDTEGAGLGLAITKKVIENHNGKISVKSKKGEGSEFTITLPKYSK